MTSRRRSTKLLSALACVSFVVAACSDDDGDSDTSEAPEITSGGSDAAPDTTAAGDTPDTTAGEDEGTDTTTATSDGGDSEGEGEGAAGEVGGSACGTPHGEWAQPESEPSGEVVVAWNDPLLSYNSSTSRGNATANNNPRYLMNLGGFSFYDGDLNYVNNDSFGTCTLDSLDPLTVTYTVNEGVTWSDGTPLDAADMLLEWAATSTKFNDAETVVTPDGQTVAADANGVAIVVGPDGPLDPESEEYAAAFDPEGATGAELLDGFSYEATTGVSFDAASEGLAPVTQVPEISEDGRSITMVWDEFYVDYPTTFTGVAVPAHVVGKNALGLTDNDEAKAAVIEAIQNGDAEALKPISEFWNTGFDFTSLPDDPELYLSYGPYLLTSYDEVSQMTFEVNPDYTWGPTPQVASIVYRIIGDPEAAVQALANEEVDIIQPQATADILTQLEDIADRGVEVITSDSATYEHVDLVMDNGGPFDPATYGGDEETAKNVRLAFLKTVPRQEIVDRLIVPLNPDATLRDSFTTVPGAPTYDDLVAENGSADFAEVDIEGAIALLEEAGVDTSSPIDVRFLFAANNPRRANEYELIRDSAAQAGFNVIDGNSPTWGQDLNNSSLYDASLFGWQSTAVDIAGTNANFVTDGQNNYGGYSSPALDELYAQLQVSADPDEQQELLVQIEQDLWAGAFGVTLFQHPGITAFNTTYVEGVSSIALAPTVFFNFWEWQAVV